MLFPALPAAMASRLGIPVAQVGSIFLLFMAGMFTVGPFHAYLGDAYKRKQVLVWSVLVMSATVVGYLLADTLAELLLLSVVQGGAFGLAATAGITVAIDITGSSRRSAANVAYALAARLGMLAGAAAGTVLFVLRGGAMVAYLSVLCGMLSILLALRVHVAFRAPIGIGCCSFDRFLLARAWLPALNVVLMAFVPGVLMPVMAVGNYSAVFFLSVLAVLAVPLTRIFVRLSHHCQRGTANTTCHLAMETGLLAGMAAGCFLTDCRNLPFGLADSSGAVHELAVISAVAALLFYLLLTRPYYKRKRVR